MSDVPTIPEALETLRRLHVTGKLDGMAVVYLGPDPGVSWLFAFDVDREGDAIRLTGGITTVQHIMASANVLTASAPDFLGPKRE